MAPRKNPKNTSKTTSISVGEFANESGVTGQIFTREEAVALRVLMAFVEGKQGAVSSDVVRDVWSITRAFAEEAGW